MFQKNSKFIWTRLLAEVCLHLWVVRWGCKRDRGQQPGLSHCVIHAPFGVFRGPRPRASPGAPPRPPGASGWPAQMLWWYMNHVRRIGSVLDGPYSVLRAYGRVMYWLPPSLVRQCITAKARVGGPRPEARPRVNLGVVPAQHVYSGLFLRVRSSRNTTIDRSDQLMKGTDYCK